MPATEYQGGSFLGRLSIRRNQVMAMEGNHDQELADLDLFQKQVTEKFSHLLSPPSPSPPQPQNPTSSSPILSISFLRNLLNTFLCCEAEFKALLITNHDPTLISKPPLDRLIPDLLDRLVKSLDICNALCLGLESVRNIHKLAQIAVSALQQTPIGDGQARRANKALHSLISAIAAEDKDATAVKSTTERAWSFGRRGANSASVSKDRFNGQFRPLSSTMAKNWSAAKQIHAMSSNLVAPRGVESNGLGLAVYMMSTVFAFVMLTLVSAIPCQERNGLGTHFPVARGMVWAQPMIGLQEKVAEEWKKKEKKGSAGLMEEMQRLEKIGQSLIDFTDSFQFPVEAERLEEVNSQVEELASICRKMEEGLVPLQQQIREVFHRVVRSRSEFLDLMDQAGKLSAPTV